MSFIYFIKKKHDNYKKYILVEKYINKKMKIHLVKYINVLEILNHYFCCQYPICYITQLDKK